MVDQSRGNSSARLSVRACAWVLASLLGGVWPCAQAQEYPSRPIRMVIPFEPGATNDILGRWAGSKLGEAFGRQVLVENRAGAGGSIGVDFVAKSPADGYTLVLGNTGNLAVNPTLYPDLPYDPVRDLQPVTLLAKAPLILVSHPSAPFKTVKDLIARAKSRPGAFTYGSGGSGSGGHLAMELLKSLAKIDVTHVPYKGAAPALLNVISGELSLVFVGAAAATVQIKAGKVHALAVSGERRLPAFAAMPTIEEAGVAGYNCTLWYGVLAPAGSPSLVVSRLQSILVRALQDPDIKARLADDGTEPAGSTPEEFSRLIRNEIALWAPLIKASGKSN